LRNAIHSFAVLEEPVRNIADALEPLCQTDSQDNEGGISLIPDGPDNSNYRQQRESRRQKS
jgi:hypothetical protein